MHEKNSENFKKIKKIAKSKIFLLPFCKKLFIIMQ